jgi:tyrocidine synthetase-3
MVLNLKIYEDIKPDDPRRFYPAYVPVYNHEPLKDFFTILKSPEEIREGVVSLVSFDIDDLICIGTGFFLPFQTLHSLQYKEDEVFIHDSFFIGKVIHSCEPNARLDMSNFSLYAIKKIKPFDPITIDYEETEAQLYQEFQCNCGAASCRGRISGYKNRESENN